MSDSDHQQLSMGGHQTTVIVIGGPFGCGKSTVGSAIAQLLGIQFIEGDELHPVENVQKMRHGVPLTDQDRLPWLKRIAAAVVTKSSSAPNVAVAAATDGAPAASEIKVVIACSALKEAYRKLLAADMQPMNVFFLLLSASSDELNNRLKRRHNHFMPVSLIESQLQIFEPPSESEKANGSTVIIDTEGGFEKTLSQAKEKITTWLLSNSSESVY